MPLLVDKYLGDTQHLTTEMHGAYLLLLMAMWKNDGELPADDKQLQTISRLPAARWRAVKPVLMKLFSLDGDGSTITQKRLNAELSRAKKANKAKAEAGAKGASIRWQTNSTIDGTAIAQPSLSHWQTGTPTPTPSPTEIQESASALSVRAQVGQALKRAGVDLVRLNLDDPRVAALIDQGATPDEFEGVGREAVKRGIANPVGWICAALVGRRAEAAAMTLAPKVDGAAQAEASVAESAAYLAEKAAIAAAARTPEARQARMAAMQRLRGGA